MPAGYRQKWGPVKAGWLLRNLYSRLDDGEYQKWNPTEQQLIRYGFKQVILKKLENVENTNRNWFDETITFYYANIFIIYNQVRFGLQKVLTQDPSNGNYILVMRKLNANLREYLQHNHSKLTWEERIKIVNEVTIALSRIHSENAIHRDLHSGNILYNQYKNFWHISDLGFCGPADKPLKSIYGNLPYIAPEVIAGKGYTFASDNYSIAMIMWEISSKLPPFANYENDYNLAMDIVNGMRPKIVSGTPLKYKKLMEQCWDADPTKRPDIFTIRVKIRAINKLCYQNTIRDVPNDKI
ncbi:kinase-like domain-containing protein [Rhizophagus irregularis DAOM 181602=DAOM 197198]|uniref:Kinase-like domain-containing protein n=2 Tax=Rhizophagus irregularis TaxID=588596 RepID=A0A2P4QSG9_RHIID|nr:kinase-like domain-containing protein [Rhizophagus irregularis DAOM 181602=DAOM 197198]POG80552.1 kinase-like domain-containing protein [Rhizophagus irregularis DAOM 181602=DAOM 197198]|eukprot:XP_025187418.1 kinase-like domain-containing protein [Rhizophagus irregularis DAOM 181602=DAOM 197198]